MRQRIPCGRKALDLLSRRSHFERELERKLAQRGYDGGEIADTLDSLRGQNLLDDRRTAREFVRARLSRAPEGRRRLRAELARRGTAGEIITETLDDLLPDDDYDLTRQAAERWLRRRQSSRSAERRRASLARHLAGRGFSGSAIFSVLEKIPWDDDDHAPEEALHDPAVPDPAFPNQGST